MRVLCTHPDLCDEATGYQRLVACISVDPELFDLFFNAVGGYRGSYYTSQEAGGRANAQLLELVAPALLAFKTHAELPSSQAASSLNAKSAKIWLAEVGKGFCPNCEGEWTTPQDGMADILNGRWEHGAEPKAKYGRKAPRFTKLRVLGGFVDQHSNEYVATAKRERAKHIHEYGWS